MSKDTNQASEELSEIFINRMWNYFGIEDKSELAHFGTIYDEAVAPLIRTEKLKLLAEVRERVVTIPVHGGTDSYYASKHIQAVPIDALTKLEAEL